MKIVGICFVLSFTVSHQLLSFSFFNFLVYIYPRYKTNHAMKEKVRSYMASITMSKFYKKSSMDSDYKKSAVAEFIAPDTQDTEPEDSQQRKITPADSTGTRPIDI